MTETQNASWKSKFGGMAVVVGLLGGFAAGCSKEPAEPDTAVTVPPPGKEPALSPEAVPAPTPAPAPSTTPAPAADQGGSPPR